MTRRLLLSYFLLTGFVLLVLEIPLGFSLAHNAEHDMLGGVGHDTTVLATLVEDTVEQRQVSAIAGPAGDYARRVGGRVVVVGSTGTTLFDSGHPSGTPRTSPTGRRSARPSQGRRRRVSGTRRRSATTWPMP